MNIRPAAPVLLVLAAAGCARLAGPAFERPDTPGKTGWSAAAQADDLARLRPDWWSDFDDPRLTGLVEAALADSFDLRVAAARVERAQALAGVAGSRRLPSLSLGGSAAFGIENPAQGPRTGTEGYEASAGLTWELDIWGKLKKGREAADAEVFASGADWRATRLVIASEVAVQYFRLRQIDDLLALYTRFMDSSNRILVLYEARAKENLIAMDVVLRQRAELQRLDRERRDLERERLVAQNGIAALLGQPAGSLTIEPDRGLGGMTAARVPPGLPSDLLERRPDILAAEYRVLAAYNLAGQARLDRLPTISLTGRGGSVSGSFGDLLRQWTLGGGPTISIPLFDPARRAQVKVREAEVKIASDQYRSTVLKAFLEVENTLVNLASRREQAEVARNALDNLRRAQAINTAKFEEGLVSQLEVLESERSLLQAEQAAADLQFRLLADTVTLFKALGGGWDGNLTPDEQDE